MNFVQQMQRSLLVLLRSLETHRKRVDGNSWVNGAHNRTIALVSELSRIPGSEDLPESDQGRLFDLLLDVGRLAMRGSPEFAGTVFTEAIAIRENSRAAHRGAARAYEGRGDFKSALTHWKKFSQLAPKDEAARGKVKLLSRHVSLQRDLVSAIRQQATAIQEHELENPNLRAFLELARYEDPSVAVHADPLGFQVLVLALQSDELLELSGQYQLSTLQLQGTRTSDFGEPQFLSAYDFRAQVQGKRVCLVANSGALRASGNGRFIDDHDIVIRFNSYVVAGSDTGVRTDVHVAIHLHDYNLDEWVPTRIILGNNIGAWRRRVRRLDPSKQDRIGDETLRYPLYDRKLCNERMEDGVAPTSGYNILRLLHLYSNFKEVNLVGFDGYRSGALRLESAMHLPHAAIHNSEIEQAWIEAHSTQIGPTRRRLHPVEPAFALLEDTYQ